MSKKCIILIVTSIIAVMALPLGLTWLTCTLYVGIIAYLAYLNNESTLIGFCVIITFQNIILIWFSKYISNTYMIILLAIKELLIYFTILRGIWLLIKEKKIKSFIVTHKYSIMLIGMVFVFIALNSIKTVAGLKSVIVSIRQMCIPFACFIMGYLLSVDESGFCKIRKTVIYVAIFMTVFGIIEMFLPENILWQKINYGEFLEKKLEYEPLLYRGVTRNFYTWDLGFLLRRLISITADPLATAHIIFFGLLLLLTVEMKKNTISKKMCYFMTVILILGCILGFSKGTFLYLIVLLAGMIYHKYGKKISTKKFFIGVGVICAVIIGALVVLYCTATNPTAITNHLDGFIKGFQNSSLFGNGMGTVGATNQALTGYEITNSESYFGVCLNQIGYIGIILMCILWFTLLIRNVGRYLKYRENDCLFMVVLMIGLSMDMLLSESSVALIGTGIYFIFMGIYERKFKENKASV